MARRQGAPHVKNIKRASWCSMDAHGIVCRASSKTVKMAALGLALHLFGVALPMNEKAGEAGRASYVDFAISSAPLTYNEKKQAGAVA